MRDSSITRRDDDNPIVIKRRYKRVNEVATPKSVLGCRSRSRPVIPTPSSYSPAPSSWPSFPSSCPSSPPPTPPPPPRGPPPPRSPVLCRQRCPRAPQRLSPPPAPQPAPPPPAPSFPRSEKWNVKKSVNSYWKMV
jgi:hypothetical protein